jgi:hypothetical protein
LEPIHSPDLELDPDCEDLFNLACTCGKLTTAGDATAMLRAWDNHLALHPGESAVRRLDVAAILHPDRPRPARPVARPKPEIGSSTPTQAPPVVTVHRSVRIHHPRVAQLDLNSTDRRRANTALLVFRQTLREHRGHGVRQADCNNLERALQAAAVAARLRPSDIRSIRDGLAEESDVSPRTIDRAFSQVVSLLETSEAARRLFNRSVQQLQRRGIPLHLPAEWETARLQARKGRVR